MKQYWQSYWKTKKKQIHMKMAQGCNNSWLLLNNCWPLKKKNSRIRLISFPGIELTKRNRKMKLLIRSLSVCSISGLSASLLMHANPWLCALIKQHGAIGTTTWWHIPSQLPRPAAHSHLGGICKQITHKTGKVKVSCVSFYATTVAQ